MGRVFIDLRTAIVPNDQQIWSLFPGRNRRFLPHFIQNKCVFLDTPSIGLSLEALYDDVLLKHHIVMSQQWAAYLRNYDRKAPSRDPLVFPLSDGKSLSAAVGNVKTLFLRVKSGDIILVGRQSIYEPILIGEVDGPFNPDDLIDVPRCNGEQAPIRKVKWLETAAERRFLPQKLSRLLSNRKTVIHIDKKEFGQDVFKYAYGDYVSGENSRYIFNGPRYKNIATQAVPGIRLITYYASAFNACELGELDTFSNMDIDEAIDSYFEQDILYSFEIDFSSPGEYILHARRAALPLLVAALISATSGDLNYAQAAGASVVNSSAPPGADGCHPVEVDQKYKAVMSSINVDLFNKLCSLNKDAQDGVGLSVGVRKKHMKK